MSATITTGDDVDLAVTLSTGTTPENIALSSTVEAVLFIERNNDVLIPVKALSSSAAGADWPNGVVIVDFTNAETDLLANFTDSDLSLQIRVTTTEPKSKTWQVDGLSARLGNFP